MAATFQHLLGRPAAAQRRHRRRGREQRAYGDFLDKDAALPALRRVPRHRAAAVARRDRHLRRRAPARRGRPPGQVARTRCRRSTSVAPRPRPATWRPGTPTSTSPGASRPPRCEARSRGSASSPAGRARRSASASGCTSITRDTSRGGLGRGRPPARRHRPRDDHARCRRAWRQRVGGPAPDARAARRLPGRPGDSPQPLGRASGWSAAAQAPRWSAATTRSPTGSRSTPRSASTSSSSPATRTSRRPTGSARASCPILRQRGRWQHPAPDSADDLGGTTPFAPTSGPAHSAAVS